MLAGGLAALGALPLGSVRKAQAGPPPPAGAQVTIRKNICTHCSVGCTVIAEVANGVWIGQEPGWDSPLNRGSHCAKGAAVRELVHGDRRLKYPMKLVNGQWTRVSWEKAIDEIGDKLAAIRDKSGPDSVYWLGSAKFSNEGSYLFRKFAAFWGTNNVDHQARICHSTTVAGVANTWGYGAMTNSYNDIRNSKTMIIHGRQSRPRRIRFRCSTCSKARSSIARISSSSIRGSRARPRTRPNMCASGPAPTFRCIYGMLWHIFKNGWEDKEFIRQRVYGMDDVRKEVEKWTPDEVERVTGVPEAQLKRVAEKFAKEKPACLIWAMGQTQHTVGTANVRASCILLLATGNVGELRQRRQYFPRPLQRAGRDRSRPRYRDLAALLRSRRRRLEALVPRLGSRLRLDARRASNSKQMMETPGIPSTRWFDATLLPKDQVAQKDNLKAMMVFGHGGNTVTRMPEAAKGIEKLDLLVVGDPHPTTWAALERAQERHLSAADLHAVRDVGLAHGVEPLAAMGRADRQADLRIEGRLRGRCICWPRSSASPI